VTTATPAKKAARRKAAEKPDPLSPQQDLAPAPAAAPAGPPDEARTAIATITSQLVEFDRADSQVPELQRKYAGVAYAVDTSKGMEDAVLARREIKKVRVDLEHARVAAKQPVLQLGRKIDERATQITAKLAALEDPIDGQIKAQERKEAERKADLERRIREVSATPAQCIGKNSAQLQEVLESLDTLPLADFQEYREQAAKAQFDAQQAVRTLLQQAKQAEELAELQAQQRREDARRAAIRQAIDAIAAPLLQLPMCRTAARVQTLIDNVRAVNIADEVYQEFAPAAREKKSEVLATLIAAHREKQSAEDAAAAAPRAEQATKTYPNGAPMFGQHVKENGDRVMLDEQGKRSVFCDVDEGDALPAARPDTVDGLPPGARRIYPDEPRESYVRSDHDRINDEGAERLHRQFGDVSAGPGRSLAHGFKRVMSRPLNPQHSEPDDPFTAPAARAGSEMAMSSAPRPSDAEMLAVVADHYEVDAVTAAGWLRTFDAAAALAQQSLIPTT
jgi:hypothetical protein